MGIKKDMESVKADIAGIKDKWNTGRADEGALMVSAIDSGLLAAKAGVKVRVLAAKTELKAEALLPGAVICASRAALKKAKKIRELQAKQTLINAAVCCESGLLPEKEKRSPKLQTHSGIPPGIAAKYRINSREGNVAVRLQGRQIHRRSAGKTGTNAVNAAGKKTQTGKIPERKSESLAGGADLSGIESRNGIKQRGNERGKKSHVSERKELHGSEKIKDIEQRNGIKGAAKSGKGKEERKKKEGKKGNKGKGNPASRQEMKRFVINQVTGNGGDESCSSGFGAMGAGILKSKVKNSLQEAAASFFKAVGKALWKLLLFLLKSGLSLLKWLLFLFLDLLITIIAASLPILLAGALIIAFFGKIAGFFGIFGIGAGGGEFVVDRIKERVAVIEKEIEKADEVRYHTYDGSCDIYMNQDDMLLVYISKMADLDDLENDDAFDGSEAPYFIVNKRKEKNTIEEVFKNMLYFRRGAYEKEVTVTVTPVPSGAPPVTAAPGPQPVPTAVPGELTVTPAPSAPPVPSVTPVPSGAPSVTPVPETTTVKVIVHTLDVYVLTAEEYLAGHGLKKNQKEVYDVLAEVFSDMGYRPGGGSVICDSY